MLPTLEPKVTLLSRPFYPVETLYLLWEASRHDKSLPSPADLAADRRHDTELNQKVTDTVREVLRMRIPVGESLTFVFLLENVSIAFREQMVRHRIGVKVGDRLGADIIPDLASSSWWSQSMRMLDMGNFFDEGRYLVPDGLTEEQQSIYFGTLHMIQCSYRNLVESGMHPENARNLLPLATTHRISWALNLSSLMHIFGKRTCWIAQLGMWGPVVRGMAEALRGVDPLFSELAAPPCRQGGRFTGCSLGKINQERVTGEDPFPPCPLWLCSARDAATAVSTPTSVWRPALDGDGWMSSHEMEQAYAKMAEAYITLWGMDLPTNPRDLEPSR